MSRVRIATRGSDLALAQARDVARRIEKALGVETELVVVRTTGDRIQDVSLAKIGGKGLFIKEIEEALLDDRADVAVHSAKDLPAEIAEGLALVAFPERADPRDALVAGAPGATLETLPKRARVGTGSTRRGALLRRVRPDLEIVPLRGNVPTRIAKLESEGLAAVVLACAGLDRLGLDDVISQRISSDLVLPAVCQGTLALEARAGEALAADLASLTTPESGISAAAERSFLRHMEGDCTVPLAGHCELLEDDRIRVRGLVCDLEGARVARGEAEGAAEHAEEIGRTLAFEVLAAGGREILDGLRAVGGDGGATGSAP